MWYSRGANFGSTKHLKILGSRDPAAHSAGKTEHRGVDTVVKKALLHAGLDLFTIEPRLFSETTVESHETLPDPVLLSWLRSFQTSCT